MPSNFNHPTLVNPYYLRATMYIVSLLNILDAVRRQHGSKTKIEVSRIFYSGGKASTPWPGVCKNADLGFCSY